MNIVSEAAVKFVVVWHNDVVYTYEIIHNLLLADLCNNKHIIIALDVN
jgi:hypothetical protein